MSNVKLAIRVRPFTDKELKSDKDRVPVVTVVDDKTVNITNIKVSLSGAGDSRERVRCYQADYTFDSSCSITHPLYASQEKIFSVLGHEVIKCISNGLSACVLAYGQSATGKTHTMMGTDTQPGLIPRLCKALYELRPNDFTISFLEIYNERVHDLLCEAAPPTCHSLPRRRGNSRKDLRVREHPTRGPYVQNLRRVSVDNAEALLLLVEEGARRRRTAATRRNSTSSRSHALLEIATPNATLHLADLAGSEKASWEGCGGGRQKEGANINKSLVALSNVISALVSGGARRGRFVPYRDSALTWLLKDCFTGGANAFIIATVSPSVACYGESASTLRWAARAWQLPTPRPTLTGPSGVSVASLQAQLRLLIAELTRNHIQFTPETGQISFDEQYWTRKEENDSQRTTLSKTANIGNIINMLRPKADANNSESTASSVASGSSDVINVVDKNSQITEEINKEMDKLFGPALERTCSGHELKITAPLRNKKRQCRSQEVLHMDETLSVNLNQLEKTLPSKSDVKINHEQPQEKPKPPQISILHENQRAEIVASVTERLYSKLKKKEEAAVSKVESVVEKKIMEPLSELKICTNARQRLMELSQKAMRNKRRIGIPAHTQTKKVVTRVRDQAIGVQNDLYAYIAKSRRLHTFYKDAATETVPMTPRCKEIGVGSTGSLDFSDKATETKSIPHKNAFMMTNIVVHSEQCTQTQIVPPPRRKKRLQSSTKHVCNHNNKNISEDCSAPVISINISQLYPADSESQSSDDNSTKPNNVSITPDLLTNHSSDKQDVIGDESISVSVNVADNFEIPLLLQTNTDILETNKNCEEFPDTDDLSLPRVSPSLVRKSNSLEIKNMILGRNEHMYPYNIVVSPIKQKDSKRIVTFKESDVAQALASVSARSKVESLNENTVRKTDESSSEATTSEKEYPILNECESIYSDSTESSKIDSDSFVWKKGNYRSMGSLGRNYVPVYKSKYKTSKASVLKDFKGLEQLENWDSDSRKREYLTHKPRRSRTYFDSDYYNNDEFDKIESKILESCNHLEKAANKYQSYVSNYNESMKFEKDEALTRRPKQYLQHLVQLRREVVKAESDNTDSSDINQK